MCFFCVPFLSRDAQTRQLQNAVTNVEKHFGELCQIFAAYVRKTARLRDKADLLVNEVNVYAATETPNLKQGLKNFADEFAKLQDYRQAEVWGGGTAPLLGRSPGAGGWRHQGDPLVIRRGEHTRFMINLTCHVGDAV